MEIRRHYLVSGRVQGVGFRNFVYKRAVSLGLQGLVRNLYDGRVEILVSGPSASIKQFETEIARGPLVAHVSGIETFNVPESASGLNGLGEFAVIADGGEPWSIDG